ncbi:putative MYB DNA-binding domain superfamily protein [Iris pallida]|uniref:MYB DNA-binding domain superfamily protein n=1 Tax=Iris pallida TaxID=29817 RepID=A0AAX6FBN5_IRIPA|nr:putative MYB DNA-binding domain superfamily protein [Iris pallida]
MTHFFCFISLLHCQLGLFFAKKKTFEEEQEEEGEAIYMPMTRVVRVRHILPGCGRFEQWVSTFNYMG